MCVCVCVCGGGVHTNSAVQQVSEIRTAIYTLSSNYLKSYLNQKEIKIKKVK